MIIIPPDILPPMPNPSPSDCATLLSYTNSVIGGLESVLNRLYEVSSYPDEALILIRNRVETMLSEAKKMRSSLNSIKAEAVNKMNAYNQEQTKA
jgi:hypothetical protein